MATSRVQVTEGSGKNLATHSFTEDAVTKELSRVVMSTSAGADISPALESGGNLAAAVTALQIIDNIVSGSEAQVDIVASLPAGTNAIGKLAANSGVDIGDVDVTSCALPTGASTSAKQDTIIGHVDGIETVLGTIDADTGNISTKIDTLAGTVTTGRVQVDASTTNVAQSGSWTVVADAGTDLNTSALALESGGNLATLAGAVSGTEMQVDVVAALPAGTNLIGDVSLQPRTGNGCSLFRSIDLDETEEEVKATAGNLYGYYFANTNASARYLKLYNDTTANVTVGTTTPVATFYLPPTSAGHVGLPFPISFSTAITAASTTGVADNDTGAPGANEVLFMAFYK